MDHLGRVRRMLRGLGEQRADRAEVDLVDVLEYEQPMSPAIIDACADLFAAEGHQWIAFNGRGGTDGLDPVFALLVATTRQYVYLGELLIAAERDDQARRR